LPVSRFDLHISNTFIEGGANEKTTKIRDVDNKFEVFIECEEKRKSTQNKQSRRRDQLERIDR